MAGYARTQAEINNRAGQLAVNLRDVLTDVARFRALLVSMTAVAPANPDQPLLDLGFTQAEVTLLRTAFDDLVKLVQIGNGNATQATAKDFFAAAKDLMGVL